MKLVILWGSYMAFLMGFFMVILWESDGAFDGFLMTNKWASPGEYRHHAYSLRIGGWVYQLHWTPRCDTFVLVQPKVKRIRSPFTLQEEMLYPYLVGPPKRYKLVYKPY